MDWSIVFCRIRIRDPTEWWCTSLPGIRIPSFGVLPFRLDSDFSSETWGKCHHSFDIRVRAFIFEFISIFFSNAVLSSEYMSRLFFHATNSKVSVGAIPGWSIKVTACVAVIFVTMLCAAASKLGTRAAVLFTTVKVRLQQAL